MYSGQKKDRSATALPFSKYRPIAIGLYPERTKDTPERRLALGILVQGFRDALSLAKSPKEVEWHVDALEWFSSEDAHTGSLRWVCHTLELDHHKLRRWLSAQGSRRGAKRGQGPAAIRFRTFY